MSQSSTPSKGGQPAPDPDAERAVISLFCAGMVLLIILVLAASGAVDGRSVETPEERACRLHDDSLRGSGREGATCAT